MKFKVEVSKIYVQTHIVEADDEDHATEIATEIDDLMEANSQTYFESELDVTQADEASNVTYKPEQDYLK